MQKVQVVNLRFIEDPKFLQEQYEMLGFTARRTGDDLELYWGKPKRVKPKDEEDEKKPERRSKTERRLGRKFDG